MQFGSSESRSDSPNCTLGEQSPAIGSSPPVEYRKDPGTWVVVVELAWPHDAGDDAEAAVTHLTAATGLD